MGKQNKPALLLNQLNERNVFEVRLSYIIMLNSFPVRVMNVVFIIIYLGNITKNVIMYQAMLLNS